MCVWGMDASTLLTPWYAIYIAGVNDHSYDRSQLMGCYVLIQGDMVSVIGPYKSSKEVWRIVLDCMKNIHQSSPS
jgi:hypothetical protein